MSDMEALLESDQVVSADSDEDGLVDGVPEGVSDGEWDIVLVFDRLSLPKLLDHVGNSLSVGDAVPCVNERVPAPATRIVDKKGAITMAYSTNSRHLDMGLIV